MIDLARVPYSGSGGIYGTSIIMHELGSRARRAQGKGRASAGQGRAGQGRADQGPGFCTSNID